MFNRTCFSLLLCLCISFCLASCGTLTQQIRRSVSTAIATDVQSQVGTAAVEQVGTAVATRFYTPPPPTAAISSEYDCEQKYCKDMSVCAEAVYKLLTCEHSRLDSDKDGIPCESICSQEQVATLTAPKATALPGEIGQVTRVIDGDTIDVLLDGTVTRIRYLQMNTPERDQACFAESSQANADLVEGKTVRLVPDKELIDPYDRLLRFVYVGDLLVNRALVEAGYAEVVLYPPNDKHYEEFKQLEAEAAAAGLGCHPSGIFDDGSSTR